jgi:hypothetical protein
MKRAVESAAEPMTAAAVTEPMGLDRPVEAYQQKHHG